MRRLALLAVLGLALSHAPAQASALPPAAAPSAQPLYASYWDGFVDHWGGKMKKQNGIIMLVLGVGAVSLFIITRGKWLK
jgi:Spy/CpxP family protein refolding chaperone